MAKQQIQLSDHFNYNKLLRFVIPSVIMMVFTSVYGVVDGFFVSNYTDKTAFAAVNLIMPFIMVLGGMGFMIGTGGAALVSMVLGEGDEERANKYFSMMIYLTLILGVVLSVIGIVFIEPIALFLGATKDMMGSCVLYGRIIITATTFFMLQNVFQSFLVTAEKPKLGLYINIIAGLVNMVLDALFVAVFKWGVAGAATATALSEFFGGIIPLIYFLKPNKSLLKLTKTSFKLRPIIKSCSNGFSELMSNISSSVIGMAYNFQLLKFIGENGISAYGVIMYVQFIFSAIYFGYSIGVSPIIGFNYGAENHKELKNVYSKSLKLIFASSIVLTVLAIVFASPLFKVFVSYDKTLLELTVHAFSIYSLAFLLKGFNVFVSSFFTSLNNGFISAAVSFLRILVFQLASVFILPALFGIEGIWWSAFVSEFLTSIVSLLFLIFNKKRYNY